MNVERVLADLRARNLALVPGLSTGEVLNLVSYLKSRPVYVGGHVLSATDRVARPWATVARAEYVCWHPHDVVRAPHLLELALRGFHVAQRFLGVEVPRLYSLNAFCTRPGPGLRPDIQDWHADVDDPAGFLPQFTLLTDATPTEAQELEGGAVAFGPAGTTFFSDTAKQHRGRKPQRERIVAWARWGATPDPAAAKRADLQFSHAYLWDGTTPVPAADLGARYPESPPLREALSLLATP